MSAGTKRKAMKLAAGHTAQFAINTFGSVVCATMVRSVTLDDATMVRSVTLKTLQNVLCMRRCEHDKSR